MTTPTGERMPIDPEASALPSGIAKPAQRALAAAGVFRLSDLRGFGEDELSALHGVGPKAVGILRSALEARGWSLARRQNAR